MVKHAKLNTISYLGHFPYVTNRYCSALVSVAGKISWSSISGLGQIRVMPKMATAQP